MNMKNILFVLLVLIVSCKKSNDDNNNGQTAKPFESAPQEFALAGGGLRETSGISYSKSHQGQLWVEQDSGNPSILYLLKTDGTITDSVSITGATNRDWEDVTIGNGPENGKSYLYIGDIGDNDLKHDEYFVYRFEEPAAGVHDVTAFDKIRFVYPDGFHDAEALVVDNNTKDIYIITKRDAKSRVYRLTYPQNTTSVNFAQFVAELGYNGVVSACLSPLNNELIIKTYTGLYYYGKNNSNLLSLINEVEPKALDYQMEAQGEAVSFAADASGFYTLSEEALGVVPKLNFYKRK
jgi:hypothetical protein